MKVQQVKFSGKWMPVMEASERSGVSHCVIRKRVKKLNPKSNQEWAEVFENGIKEHYFPQDLYERMIAIMDEALLNRKGLRIV